eukprot:11353949-Heterocapsa_arctica.AAC.1
MDRSRSPSERSGGSGASSAFFHDTVAGLAQPVTHGLTSASLPLSSLRPAASSQISSSRASRVE